MTIIRTCVCIGALLMVVGLATGAPVKVIFDTDMDTDCDDIGALAMLHVLADQGEAEILATVVSSRNEWSPLCVNAINTFYGRPQIPIGRPELGAPDKASRYARQISDSFPHPLPSSSAVGSAVEVYRTVLAAQPDDSVVIVTVGYLTNVAALLRTPATASAGSGVDLIRSKVKCWVCMGGNFIGRPAVDDMKLGNNNFSLDAEAALYAIGNWPSNLVFVGREIGSVPSGLKVGAALAALPKEHIVRTGYSLYFGGTPKDRHVADQTAVLFAVRGARDYWDTVQGGWLDLKPDMTFHWRDSPDRRQGYVIKRAGSPAGADRYIEKTIETLMLTPPAR